MIPTPFWKPSGNQDILLWVPFTDGTAKDISVYNRTLTTTITGGAASVGTNFFHINITSASPTTFSTALSYAIPNGFTISQPITAEGFIKWIASPPNSLPAEMFTFLTDGSISNLRNWLQIYSNAGNVAHSSTGGGVDGPTVSNPLTPSGTEYHWAWVFNDTDNAAHIYINGVQVLTFTATHSTITFNNNAAFLIGYQAHTNGAPNHTELYLGETRVSRVNLYPNGTTFTPPTPGNLPPVP